MADDSEELMSDMTQLMPKMSIDEIKTIPIVCPWCNKIYTISKWKVERNKKIGVSHGICPQCYKKMRKKGKV